MSDHRERRAGHSRREPMRRSREPMASIGDVVYLPVVTVNETGAFLDWGHSRDLLLPYGEQHFRPIVGRRVLVKIYADQQGRPVASQRLDRHIEDVAEGLGSGDAVDLVIADSTDLGYKAVVDRRCWGLLYRDEVTKPLRRGQRVNGYVKRVRDDGRLDLSLLPPGPARLDVVGDSILKALRESGGYLPLGDKSSAEAIKARLGVSKSAFKQAVGRLYKQGTITLEPQGIRLVPGGNQDSHGAS